MIRNGLKYAKPVTFMRDYLAGIKAGPFKAPVPPREPPVVIAGLLPKMLRLGAEASDGIITALMPPAHIARLRATLCPNKLLLAQQMVIARGRRGKGPRGRARLHALLPQRAALSAEFQGDGFQR
jgi:alkanesulfonate monooxygenase SsuD/methylene tetrahydromethanopterin reductase-like flavin-dependent oxidoreductase (luciferase family)